MNDKDVVLASLTNEDLSKELENRFTDFILIGNKKINDSNGDMTYIKWGTISHILGLLRLAEHELISEYTGNNNLKEDNGDKV